MQTIIEKIELFKTIGMLDETGYEIINQWVKVLEKNRLAESEKLEVLITHCVCMMSRASQNENIDELPQELMDQIQKNVHYEQSLKILQKMEAIHQIEAKERSYVLLHLCNCMEER